MAEPVPKPQHTNNVSSMIDAVPCVGTRQISASSPDVASCTRSFERTPLPPTSGPAPVHTYASPTLHRRAGT
eukprot:3827446-Prorocentrum_lima.AAC.1